MYSCNRTVESYNRVCESNKIRELVLEYKPHVF